MAYSPSSLSLTSSPPLIYLNKIFPYFFFNIVTHWLIRGLLGLLLVHIFCWDTWGVHANYLILIMHLKSHYWHLLQLQLHPCFLEKCQFRLLNILLLCIFFFDIVPFLSLKLLPHEGQCVCLNIGMYFNVFKNTTRLLHSDYYTT